MRWFKMDVGLPTDSKVITLPSDSHRWLWACVLCSAGKERKGGYVGPSYDAKYLSRITDFSEGEIPEALAMFAAGEEPLIEFSKGGIQILNWKKWQSDAEYMAKYREGKGENLQSKSKNLTELPEDKKREDKKREDNIKPTVGEAKKYYVEKLGHKLAAKMESVIYDFKNTRKTKTLAPSVLMKIVDGWLEFNEKILLDGKKAWDESGYAREGKDEHYFKGILRRLAKDVEVRRASQVGAHR